MTWTIYDEWFAGLHWAIDADDDPAGPPERRALFGYLSGTMTTDEAVHVLREEVKPANRSATRAWGFLIDIIEEFPQDHGKLLELLDAVAQLLTARGEFEEGFRFFEWDLQMYFGGRESDLEKFHSSSYHQHYQHHYINLSAFIARFWHHRHGEWTNWAMQLSQKALEADHDKLFTNLFGQAVAQLFLFSGPEMYANSKSSQYKRGPLLLKERETATVSCWEFWKRRLSQLKESELLSDETRKLFSKALESMAKVEAETG